MKKLFFFGAIVLVLFVTGCSKDSETQVLDTVKKDVVSKILVLSSAAGEDSTGAAQMIKEQMQRIKSAQSSFPFSFTIDQTVKDSIGNGSITITGLITGAINDDYTSSTQKYAFDEVFSNYTVVSENKNYTCTGTIKYVGDFAFANAESFTYTSTIKGTIAIKGTNYNQNAVIDVTCKSSGNASGSNYTVTGTIDGQSVNYNYK